MFAAFRHLLGLIKNRGILFDIFSDKSQVDYKVLRDGVPIGYEVSQGNINIVNIHLEQAPGLGQSSLVESSFKIFYLYVLKAFCPWSHHHLAAWDGHMHIIDIVAKKSKKRPRLEFIKIILIVIYYGK